MLLNIGSIVFLSVFQWLYCYIFPPWNVQTRNSLINKIIFYFTFPVYRQTVNKPQILAGFVIIISSIHEEGASMNWINLHNCFLARSRNYENRLLACRVCVFICTSVRPSVRPHGTTRFRLGEFSWHLVFGVLFENMSRKFNYHSKLRRMAGSFED